MMAFAIGGDELVDILGGDEVLVPPPPPPPPPVN